MSAEMQGSGSSSPHEGGELLEQPAPAQPFTALAGLLLREHSTEAVAQLVVSVARWAIVGVDGASLTVISRGQFATAAASSDEFHRCDQAQVTTGQGPGIEATAGGGAINVNVAETRARWPGFAATARAAGCRVVLSTPMAVRGTRLGALNLYSRAEAGFDTAAEQAARMFADQAAVLMANTAALAASETINGELAEALTTRDIIGQAKGILMTRQRISADEAFAVLRKRAHASGRKVRDVADELVQACQAPRGGTG